jgi:BlaI family penicillinase repressor
MASGKVELTETEWLVIKQIWKHEPCAAPTIQEALEKTKGWSYSTVRTIMDRMAAKGLLATEKFRNLTLFRSVVTKSQAQRRELLYALKNAFNGALTPMVQCLLDSQDISPDELAELEKLIKAKKAKK